MTYGFLGTGSITTALVTGLCHGIAHRPDVVLSPRNAERARHLSAQHASVRVAGSNQDVVDASEVVLICLRPEDARTVLSSLTFRPDHSVISAMAGINLADVSRLVAPAGSVARSIPLPAVATRSGLTTVHPATSAAISFFDALGGTLKLTDESAFEATAAVSGTVAAFFHHLGTMADWLSDHGLPGDQARLVVADTYASLAAELTTPGADFRALATAHTTPGGLNEQFTRSLQQARHHGVVRLALDALLHRILDR